MSRTVCDVSPVETTRLNIKIEIEIPICYGNRVKQKRSSTWIPLESSNSAAHVHLLLCLDIFRFR